MQFFGMGVWEILVIMVIALIIFGPGRLPEIGAQVGRAVRDFRSATKDLTGEFERTMHEVELAADEVKQSAQEVRDTTRDVANLDQATTPATKPAKSSKASRPLARGGNGPARAAHSNAEVIQPASVDLPETPRQRMPTKADPLADLMVIEPTPSGASNGHRADGKIK